MHAPESFPKIPAYRGSHDPVHLVRRVVCMEKLDGANARVGVGPGAAGPDDLRLGGRELLEHEPGFSLPDLIDVVRGDRELVARLVELAAELDAPLTLHGELCGGRIQKLGFIYGARPHLVLFAARIGGAWLGHTRALPRPGGGHSLPSLTQIAARLQLPIAPVVYAGAPDDAVFAGLVERPSAHSRARGFDRDDVDTTQEGIVIWTDPVLLTPFADPIVAKFKVPHRREYAPPDLEDGDDGVEGFAERAIGLERLRHAREHLESRGRWREPIAAMKDAVIKRAIQDVAREVDEYHARLRQHGKKAVRAALRQVAEARWSAFVADAE